MLLGIPALNGLGKTSGVEKAPGILLDKSGSELIAVDNTDISRQQELIYAKVSQALPQTLTIVGGDHSISNPIGFAFLEHCKANGKEPALIVFDAHADCMPPMKEPTHEEWLRALIAKGFPKDNIILMGARDIEKTELSFLERAKVKMITVEDVRHSYASSMNAVQELLDGKELYISFDIDVLDSSIVKATGYPSPGGFTESEAMDTLQRISRIKKPRVFDLVEVNPILQGKEKTIEISARIIKMFT